MLLCDQPCYQCCARQILAVGENVDKRLNLLQVDDTILVYICLVLKARIGKEVYNRADIQKINRTVAVGVACCYRLRSNFASPMKVACLCLSCNDRLKHN